MKDWRLHYNYTCLDPFDLRRRQGTPLKMLETLIVTVPTCTSVRVIKVTISELYIKKMTGTFVVTLVKQVDYLEKVKEITVYTRKLPT